MPEVELSESVYAAFCLGTDQSGTWLWCSGVGKKINLKRPFYADVDNGAWQLKYDPVARLGTVVATKQQIFGLRLAGIGKVPAEWLVETHGDYNEIIDRYLRSGEYHGAESFVHDRI